MITGKFIKPNISDFEEWCLQLPDHSVRPVLKAEEVFKKVEGVDEQKYDLLKAAIDKEIVKKTAHLRFSAKPDLSNFAISHPDPKRTFHLKDDIAPDVMQLDQHGAIILKISGLSIRMLSLRNVNETEISNCFIGDIEFGGIDQNHNLILRDCYVGHLRLLPGCLRNLTVERGTIRKVECPPPDGKNPFTGTITFTDVGWPTRKKGSKLFEGEQQYHNLRSHLQALENNLEAGRMRALELESEREKDKGLNWFFSLLYGAVSGYGIKPGRPWIWWAVFVAFAFVVMLFDGGAYTGTATDWKSVFADEEIEGRVARAIALPFQSMVNPFGILNPKNIISPNTVAGMLVLFFQGFLCDVMVAASILAIRKRFRLHQ